MNKTGMTILSSAVLAVVLTAGALWGTGQLRTVEQKAAEAQPPARSELTATVTEGVLSESISLLCTSGYRKIDPVTITASEGNVVITSAPIATGHTVTEGELLATVNGKPVIAVFGEFPLYRDLQKADHGPDALLMNQFLIRTGYLVGSAEDVFSSSSIIASQMMLKARGFPQPDPSDWKLPFAYFSNLSGGGTVTGPAAKPGILKGDSLFSVGIGRKGLLCTGNDGTLPAIIKAGSVVTVPSLGDMSGSVELVDKPDSGRELATTQQGAAQSGGDQSGLVTGTSSVAFIQLPDNVTEPASQIEGRVALGGTPDVATLVPNSAIWTRNGDSVVTRIKSDGSRDDIPVLIKFTANGLNAVETDGSGEKLVPGDTVLIGGK